MIPFLLPAATALLFLTTWFFAVAGFALRDFSRNQIDALCKSRNVEHRFRDILDHHQQALLSMELGMCATFLGLVGLIFFQWESWSLFSDDLIGWVSLFTQLLALFGGLMVWVVVIPRTWARVGGETYLVRTWPLIRIANKIASPALKAVAKFDRMAHRLAGVPENTNGTLPSLTQEILAVVDEGQRDGLIEPQARKMIRRVMELQEEDVAAIMTPRTEMHVIQVDMPLDQARVILLEGGHSRVPVVGESTDDIIGVLYAKDLLQHLDQTNGRVVSLRDIVREAIYIPETTGIDTLLERMKREHVHIAIVIDEYSGVAGLVTLEDILEEIVGEITDEYDIEEEEDIHQISSDVIEVDARVHVDELNEQFEFDLPEDGDFETVGGFVFNQLGRVPKKNETFTWRNLRVTVLSVGKRKIHKLRIEIDRTLAAATTEEV